MNYKEDFKMLNHDLIYFDNAATSFKPNSVIKKMNEYYEDYCSNIKRGDYDISFRVDSEYESVRNLVQEFINAKNREEIVFTSGTTESMNFIVKGFFKNILTENDEILITKSEHASNILPWYDLVNEMGCVVNYILLNQDYEVTLENVKLSITPNTKVISLAHITNVVGDIRPIKEIVEYAHSLGIFVVVDGAQSIPHMKVDVEDLGCDFLVFSAHKMCGPTGVGIIYAPKLIMEKIKPQNMGGGMNESFANPKDIIFKDIPYRLEGGTPNIAGVLGLGEAIKYLQKIGLKNIQEHEKNLKIYLVKKLVAIPYIDVINIKSPSGIVAFNVDKIFSQDVAFYLNKYNICVRAGNHCAKELKDVTGVTNTVRLSLYFYNTIEEIDDFIDLMSDRARIEREML